MPEGDTIFRAARTLNRALASHQVTAFETVLPHLDRVNVDTPLIGRTIQNVTAQGKWLLIHFSEDLILLTHMLMSGSWHIYRPGEIWQRPARDMRIVIHTANFVAVAFSVPIAKFHTADSLSRDKRFASLGPSVLADSFDSTAALERLRSVSDMEVGEALLNQSVMAGIGNVYKSEICFLCKIDPFRLISSLSVAETHDLVAAAYRLLTANVAENSTDRIVTYTGMRRTTGRSDPSERLYVYRRAGEPCRHCATPILSRKQGPNVRTTFWCPQCQPAGARLIYKTARP
jgi:endonuclease VIII